MAEKSLHHLVSRYAWITQIPMLTLSHVSATHVKAPYSLFHMEIVPHIVAISWRACRASTWETGLSGVTSGSSSSGFSSGIKESTIWSIKSSVGSTTCSYGGSMKSWTLRGTDSTTPLSFRALRRHSISFRSCSIAAHRFAKSIWLGICGFEPKSIHCERAQQFVIVPAVTSFSQQLIVTASSRRITTGARPSIQLETAYREEL